MHVKSRLNARPRLQVKLEGPAVDEMVMELDSLIEQAEETIDVPRAHSSKICKRTLEPNSLVT